MGSAAKETCYPEPLCSLGAKSYRMIINTVLELNCVHCVVVQNGARAFTAARTMPVARPLQVYGRV